MLSADLRQVGDALTAAEAGVGVRGQDGDEGVNTNLYEGALAGAGFDQAQGDQLLDRVSDRVPRGLVLIA